MSDIEKKIYDIKDSTRMYGMNDRLERIVRETKASAGIEGMRALSEDELNMVAGGKKYMSGELPDGTAAVRKGVIPKGGLQC